MRVGTVLRILGLIIFFAGIIGGFLIGYGSQSLIAAFTSGVNGNASASGFVWVAAIISWVSSSILSGLIYAIGVMSNNLDDMNSKLEEVQNNTLETTKALRHIAHVVSKRASGEMPNDEMNGAVVNAQYAQRNYMRSRANSTDD
jgi:hypothetical protein